MLEIKSHIDVEMGSEKNFGITFSVIFFLIYIYTIVVKNESHWWILVISGVLFLAAFFMPKLLFIPNRIWFKFGTIMGVIVGTIIMAIIFFLVFTPVGLVFRIIRKDLIKQKIDKQTKSYWIKRNHPAGTMKNQF